ncbi:MAG: hypothetical protein DI606_16330 [Sphingobium sp.]|uniref:hypothetical protein n=1 Tax=Sphingobium sp. TaxID=1912891 RepID=UPI000DB3C07E|nr:hypothetical protein [Sphingobium sp.]PZU07648.1 MAG: hypothetical protein DI606_16330 [Sphingobium sp.]
MTTSADIDEQLLREALENQVTELHEAVKNNDIGSIFHAIENAELEYSKLEMPLEMLKQVEITQRAILQAHERLNDFTRAIAEATKQEAAKKANEAFHEVEKHMKSLVGNGDYPKIFVTQITGSTPVVIKALINKKLPKDRYLRGSSFNAFVDGAAAFPYSKFGGSELTKPERDKLLFLRLDSTEAIIAKTTCTEKSVVIDDPDASKWSSMVIAAHISRTTLDTTWYDNHFQKTVKVMQALLGK